MIRKVLGISNVNRYLCINVYLHYLTSEQFDGLYILLPYHIYLFSNFDFSPYQYISVAKQKKHKETIDKELRKLNGESKNNSSSINNDMSFWRNNWIKACILFFLCGLLYYQGIDYGYVLDDAIVIKDNQFTNKGASGVWDILTNESMTGYFGEQKNLVQGSRYRPLSLVTFALEVEAFGLSPRVGHINNIIFYGLTCIVIFWMLYLLLIQRDEKRNTFLGLAFITALIYTLHPVHTEAVANIKGRDEIMAMFFSGLTVISVIHFVYSKKIWQLVVVAIMFFLGLLSKENTITFLAIIPAMMYFFTDSKKKEYISVMGTLLLITGIYLKLRFAVAGVPDFSMEITDVMNNPFVGMTVGQKLATISYTLLKYIGLSIAPIQLSHDYYPYAIPILNWGDYRAILGLLVHIGLVGVLFWKLKSKSVVSFSILFYLAALSIVSNVIINVGTFMNERFIFISTVGSTLLITYLLRDKLSNWKKPVGKYFSFGILGLMIIGYTLKTYTRIPDWESALTLNQSAVKVSTNSARANSFMSTALYNNAVAETDRDKKMAMVLEGQQYANKAASLIPNYKNAQLMRAGIAGELHKMDQDLSKLLATFKDVGSNRPDIPFIIEYIEYLRGSRISDEEIVDFYYDLGYNELLMRKYNYKWAMHYLSKAYEITKTNAKLNKAIGDNYKMMGDTTNANKFYQAAGVQ